MRTPIKDRKHINRKDPSRVGSELRKSRSQKFLEEQEFSEHCTFSPSINKRSASRQRGVKDLLRWDTVKQRRIASCILEDKMKNSRGLFKPKINRRSEMIMTRRSGSTFDRLYWDGERKAKTARAKSVWASEGLFHPNIDPYSRLLVQRQKERLRKKKIGGDGRTEYYCARSPDFGGEKKKKQSWGKKRRRKKIKKTIKNSIAYSRPEKRKRRVLGDVTDTKKNINARNGKSKSKKQPVPQNKENVLSFKKSQRKAWIRAKGLKNQRFRDVHEQEELYNIERVPIVPIKEICSKRKSKYQFDMLENCF